MGDVGLEREPERTRLFVGGEVGRDEMIGVGAWIVMDMARVGGVGAGTSARLMGKLAGGLRDGVELVERGCRCERGDGNGVDRPDAGKCTRAWSRAKCTDRGEDSSSGSQGRCGGVDGAGSECSGRGRTDGRGEACGT